MSLESLGSLLREEGSVGAGPALPNLDEVAQAILALPLGRRRMRDVERAVLDRALAVSDGNVTRAAALLGVTRQAVQRRVRGSSARAER